MNHDEVLDRLLDGLRTAEPREGMERRILHTMETRPAILAVRWRFYAAAACSAAIAAAWWIATIKVPQVPSMPMYSPQLSAVEVPLPSPVLRKPAPGHTHPATVAEATSFPAPPLPLTDQEKLLLRLAHQRDSNRMAELNPALHAAQIAKANEQFQQFFDIDDKEMRRQSE